jgi:hypothetical protein
MAERRGGCLTLQTIKQTWRLCDVRNNY